MLTLHQLEVFTVVAEEMSVGRAAERLVVTQPAVSASLASLQREVGVALIEREGRGIALTDAGRAMFKYAQLVLGLIDEAMEATKAADDAMVRPIRIGATSSLVSHVVAPILTQLRERDPDLQFALEIGNRTQVWRQLANHETDLALSTQPPSTQAFVSLATMPNSFVLVGRPGLVWSGRLAETTWLVREDGAVARAASDEVLARLGIEPTTMIIHSDDAIRGSIEAGLGIGVLPHDVVGEALRQRQLVTIPTSATPLPQAWHLLIRRTEAVDDHLARFVVDMVAADPKFSWTGDGRDLVS